jgi:hypothetical protein
MVPTEAAGGSPVAVLAVGLEPSPGGSWFAELDEQARVRGAPCRVLCRIEPGLQQTSRSSACPSS